ncbi:MAG TPA: BamA/TamA family outer membrane protein [Bryobacteraceae bacterium]|nr:BamA/TamA family outer membrane protein [Bryobacteraceae bacterium]
MRFIPTIALLLAAGALEANVPPAAPENVNSRYLVESVEIDDRDHERLSSGLRRDIDELVGTPFEQVKVDDLAGRIRKELRAMTVEAKLLKGSTPQYIRVAFHTTRRRLEEDASVTKASYHSQLGWTGGVEGNFHLGANQVAAGVQSDGDELVERYAGFNFRISRPIGESVRVRFSVERFHQQWNAASLQAMESDGFSQLYRTRINYEPSISFALTQYLTLTTGMSFQQLEYQFPVARFESAHAVIGTLRYRRRWVGSGSSRQEVDAGYSLRAATNILDSDFAYTRHYLQGVYSKTWSDQEVLVRAGAGTISGTAPLFEQFVVGNTQLLRGWNKYELAPLGGGRVAHGSAEYRYRIVRVFYDTGSVWNRDRARVLRHSAGASLLLGKLRDGLAVSVAFPLRAGRIEPMFIVSTNF